MGQIGSTRKFRMPSEGASARAAASLMGSACQPGYDVDNARELLLLGADVFESMPASPHFRMVWANRPDDFSAFFGPVRGASAALCRDWHPSPEGAQASLAMGLAWHLADMGLVTGRARDMADFIALVRQRFRPEDVRLATGMAPEVLRQMALRLSEGTLPILGTQGGEGLGLAAHVAGFALSVMTGGINRPGGVYLTGLLPGESGNSISGAHMQAKTSVSLKPLDAGQQAAVRRSELGLAGEFKRVGMGRSDAPDVLLLVEADPVAGLPETELVARAVAKALFKVAFTPVMTTSARICDLILPAPMPLERWDDVTTPYGLAFACYGLSRPLVRTRADARHPGDVLLELATRLERPLVPSSFRQALRERVLTLEKSGGFVFRGVSPWRVLAGDAQPAPEADLWKSLVEGQLWVNPQPVRAELACQAAFLAKALIPEAVDLGLPLKLAPQASLRTCMPGGVPLQSVTSLRPDEVQGGKSVLRLNSRTGKTVRVKPGDLVRVISPAGRVEALVAFDESVMDGHAALLLGLGEGFGANVRQVQSTWTEPQSNVEVWAGCRVRLERI
jgi:anaerobic selenocysteine-containing dehydrogenase